MDLVINNPYYKKYYHQLDYNYNIKQIILINKNDS